MSDTDALDNNAVNPKIARCIDSMILDILACPICKGKLRYDKAQQELICMFDKLAYPIKEGVPIMMVSEAKRIKDEDSTR
jgi:uncharacterized protein